MSAVAASADTVTAMHHRPFRRPGHRGSQIKTFPAYVMHGVNVYNGKKIFDFTGVSNKYTAMPPLVDIGVFNPTPNATNATEISEETSKDSLMATLFPWLHHATTGGSKPDPVGPFNVPIFKTPTFTPASRNITDRREPASFEESGDVSKQGNYQVYRWNANGLTLKEYNAAWGWMKVTCRRDGTGSFKIKIKGIPFGLYTAWDMIVKKPLTAEESTTVSPFGGAPNVIATDRRGFGRMERKLNYCPLTECKDTERCTVGVIMLYHFDHMVYGSGSQLASQGFGPGVAASHHLMFLTNGKALTEAPRWIG